MTNSFLFCHFFWKFRKYLHFIWIKTWPPFLFTVVKQTFPSAVSWSLMSQRWRRRLMPLWWTSAVGWRRASWRRWPRSRRTWWKPTFKSAHPTGARWTLSATSTRCVLVQSQLSGGLLSRHRCADLPPGLSSPSGARRRGVFPRGRPSVSAPHPDGGYGLDCLRAADGSDGPQILKSIADGPQQNRMKHEARWRTLFPPQSLAKEEKGAEELAETV